MRLVGERTETGGQAARPPGVVLQGALERITYVNEETGYTIARVATERSGDELLTVVGPLLGAQVGESLRMTGRWTSHPRYGRQFEVWSYVTVLPATIQGIQRYLGSGLIKGIGPKMAERIVAHFGVDTLEVIEKTPERLLEVPGTMHVRSQGSSKKGRNLVYGSRYARVVVGTWWREGCPRPVAERAPAFRDR